MKKIFTAVMMFSMAAAVAGCAEEQRPVSDIVYIQLSDRRITVDGQNLSEGSAGGVSLSNDIVYYREGQGRDYGEDSLRINPHRIYRQMPQTTGRTRFFPLIQMLTFS